MTNNVGEDDRVFAVIQNALHLFGLRSGFDGGVDFFNGDVARNFANEVDDRTSRGRNAEGNTGQLAINGRNDKADSLCGAGGRRDDVDGSGASAIDVLIGFVKGDLVVREGVNRRHKTFNNTEVVVKNFGNRGKAVGRAGSVGDVFLIGGQFFVVNAENTREDVVAFRRSGNNNLLNFVAVITFFIAGSRSGEETSGFENDVRAKAFPRNAGRFGFLADRNLFAVDDKIGFIVFNGAVEATLRRVVLQKESQGFRIGEVVDTDDIVLLRSLRHLTEDDTTNTTKTINTNINSSHCKSP